MDCNHYEKGFHEALSRAFAARADNVRSAYFDLATFYYDKLGGDVRLSPSEEILRHCLGDARRSAAGHLIAPGLRGFP